MLRRSLSILAATGLALALARCGPSSDRAKTEPESPKNQEVKAVVKGLLIVERDVPQIRTGFVPVINHEALVVNTSANPAGLEIESPFSKSFDVTTKFYPAFGRNSLLGEPMRFPTEVKISNYQLLEKPAVESRNQEMVYAWRGLSLPAGDAVIAQYDQYMGPLAQYYRPAGKLQLLQLAASFTPTVETQEGVATLRLAVLLENQGPEVIEGLRFDVFVPDLLHSLEGNVETPLLENPVASASPDVTYDRETVADAKERPATGTQFRYSRLSLLPGEKAALEMTVRGRPRLQAETSHFLVTVQGLSKGERIWPQTLVKAIPALPTERFYYRQYNLVIPAPVLFRFGPKGVTTATFFPPANPPSGTEK